MEKIINQYEDKIKAMDIEIVEKTNSLNNVLSEHHKIE